MLVLTRKAGEKVIILKRKSGDESEVEDVIEISMIKVQGGKVSIGIDAAKERWDIVRSELIEDELAPIEEEAIAVAQGA